MHKYVYLFSEGNADMRNLLGGKGANLAEMTNIGLPVPQGFTITTEACTQYYEDGKEINEEIRSQINEYAVTTTAARFAPDVYLPASRSSSWLVRPFEHIIIIITLLSLPCHIPSPITDLSPA